MALESGKRRRPLFGHQNRLAWITTAALLLGACSSHELQQCDAQPLQVLLTNDDGVNAPGIVALHAALKQAGHQVTRAAPNRNYSGSAASLTNRPTDVEQLEDNVYAVDASPATSVMVGLAILDGARPDLIISGTNRGANVGPAAVVSGTVGATVAALRLVKPPISGIAFSTDLPQRDANHPDNAKHWRDAAQYAARLVDQLNESACGDRLLPPGIALNVNFPAIPFEEMKGVRVATQGELASFMLSFSKQDDGLYAPGFADADPSGDHVDSDSRLLRAGYITIVPIDANYTAASTVRRAMKRRLEKRPITKESINP